MFSVKYSDFPGAFGNINVASNIQKCETQVIVQLDGKIFLPSCASIDGVKTETFEQISGLPLHSSEMHAVLKFISVPTKKLKGYWTSFLASHSLDCLYSPVYFQLTLTNLGQLIKKRQFFGKLCLVRS